MESAQVSVNRCMNADNAVCMHNGDLFAIKKNKIGLFEGKRMQLEIILLSEVIRFVEINVTCFLLVVDTRFYKNLQTCILPRAWKWKKAQGMSRKHRKWKLEREGGEVSLAKVHGQVLMEKRLSEAHHSA